MEKFERGKKKVGQISGGNKLSFEKVYLFI